MIKLAPSILSADFANLERDIKEVERAGAHYLHVDVMDGLFVPNITIGPPVIRALKKVSKMVFDVHLMIERPERYIQLFCDCGADIINVHLEACTDIKKTIEDIKATGARAGVTIKPETNVSGLLPVLKYIDLALVMTVNPGFGGQHIIMETLDKVKELREIADSLNLNIDIEVDGGININNVKTAIKAGANVIVAGSSIFNDKGIFTNARMFIEAIR